LLLQIVSGQYTLQKKSILLEKYRCLEFSNRETKIRLTVIFSGDQLFRLYLPNRSSNTIL